MSLQSITSPRRAGAPGGFPTRPWGIPNLTLRSGSYSARFARTLEDLEAAQRLRYEVFNVELEEGLASSCATGLDQDQYDARCHHLLVEDTKTGRIVGTYRLMTQQMAGSAGFYSANEFHLESLPPWILSEGVEAGRACVAADHRAGRVIYLLWKGIAQYLAWNRKRYLFGCCSIPATDPGVGTRAQLELARQGHFMEGVVTSATSACSCRGARPVTESVELPPLFRVYLDMGSKVCSEAAIDREFGVVDFLVALDVETLDARTRRRMFGNAAPAPVRPVGRSKHAKARSELDR